MIGTDKERKLTICELQKQNSKSWLMPPFFGSRKELSFGSKEPTSDGASKGLVVPYVRNACRELRVRSLAGLRKDRSLWPLALNVARRAQGPTRRSSLKCHCTFQGTKNAGNKEIVGVNLSLELRRRRRAVKRKKARERSVAIDR